MPTAEPLPTLTGDRVLLRPGRVADADALAAILAEPAVTRWWGDPDLEELRGDLPEALVIVVDGAVAGWVLVDEETDPQYRRVGLDIALATALHGRGLGRETLRLVIAYYVGRGHHRFTIDPTVSNERAIRTYGALGFRPVGVMRAYERAPDGTWRDGLLMDLLADELVDG